MIWRKKWTAKEGKKQNRKKTGANALAFSHMGLATNFEAKRRGPIVYLSDGPVHHHNHHRRRHRHLQSCSLAIDIPNRPEELKLLVTGKKGKQRRKGSVSCSRPKKKPKEKKDMKNSQLSFYDDVGRTVSGCCYSKFIWWMSQETPPRACRLAGNSDVCFGKKRDFPCSVLCLITSPCCGLDLGLFAPPLHVFQVAFAPIALRVSGQTLESHATRSQHDDPAAKMEEMEGLDAAAWQGCLRRCCSFPNYSELE